LSQKDRIIEETL